MKYLITLILLTISLNAFSEYRVYQYYVKSTYDFPNKKNAYIITSTLSPTSYLAYHGGNLSLELNLLQTWICKGYTGHQDVCKGPLISSNEQTNRGELN